MTRPFLPPLSPDQLDEQRVAMTAVTGLDYSSASHDELVQAARDRITELSARSAGGPDGDASGLELDMLKELLGLMTGQPGFTGGAVH